MSSVYCLWVDSSYSLDAVWEDLEAKGIEVLYSLEEEGQKQILVTLSSLEVLNNLTWIIAYSLYSLPSIDWHTQWAIHNEHYQEGYVCLDFKLFGLSASSLWLKPGPGFGDLSHPTTYLMLNFLVQYLHKQVVIDIGCGSGILSLAAIKIGAQFAYGFDIDYQALAHSRENAQLNNLQKQCKFYHPSQFQEKFLPHTILVLMNMIQMEQIEAWSSLSYLHNRPLELITSGIRVEERDCYIKQILSWGWNLVNEQEKMGWLVFYFKNQ